MLIAFAFVVTIISVNRTQAINDYADACKSANGIIVNNFVCVKKDSIINLRTP